MTDSWELTVPGRRPRRPGEAHWAVIKKEKDQWAMYLAMLAASRKIPKCQPGERRNVTITFYRPGVVSDKDNTYAACKTPLDALVRARMIEDDSPRHINLKAYSVTASKSRTVIILSRVD